MDKSLELFGKCPYATVQKVFSGKWVILIIHHLEKGTLRFGELKRKLPEVTQATLTKQLRELEHSGMIKRNVYPEVPPRVEYSLTEIGREFISVLDEFEIFGNKYIEYMNNSVSK